MSLRLLVSQILGVGLLILVHCGSGTCPASAQDSKPAYIAADVVVEYRDGADRVVRHSQKFALDDAKVVAEIATHFPGILGDRGSGPRTGRGWKSKITILFRHRSGDNGKMRAIHLSPEYAYWCWRDNTPYTGDRRVDTPAALRKLIEHLAAKHRVDLK